MIKINLLKNKARNSSLAAASGRPVVAGGEMTSAFDLSLDDGFTTESSGALSSLIKILLMCAFALALFLMEKNMGLDKKQRLDQLNVELESLRNISQEKSQNLADFETIKADYDFKSQQVQEIKSIRQNRFRLISVLDGIQASLSKGLWISRINYSPEEGLRVEGGAFRKRALDQFVNNLKRQDYVANVLVLKDTEASAQNGGSLLDFSLSLSLNLKERVKEEVY